MALSFVKGCTSHFVEEGSDEALVASFQYQCETNEKRLHLIHVVMLVSDNQTLGVFDVEGQKSLSAECFSNEHKTYTCQSSDRKLLLSWSHGAPGQDAFIGDFSFTDRGVKNSRTFDIRCHKIP